MKNMTALDVQQNRMNQYDEVIKALRETFGSRLKTVVLFGSQARGTAKSFSDHDLFVVIEALSRDPIVRLKEVRSVLVPIVARTPGPIAFTAKTPEEFSLNLTPLLLDISTDGVCLYGEAFFEPYRSKALKAIRSARLHRKEIGGNLIWEFPSLPKRDWEITWDGYREI